MSALELEWGEGDIRWGADEVRLARELVDFPVPVHPPDRFDPAELSTWPRVVGRLEWVGGRLWLMPPCGDTQQLVTVDVVYALRTWSEAHPEWFIGGNEAGMLLGGDVRAADAAVWRRSDVSPLTGGLPRIPPVLAAEVAGREENEPLLREKAAWYLAHGVIIIWIVLPASHEVVVVTSTGESRHGRGARIPEHPALPGLGPSVDSFFGQLR